MKVDGKTDAGYNQIEGYGYISESFGYDTAAFYTVKYMPVYDGGRSHKLVRLCNLTPFSPFNDCFVEDLKRTRNLPVPETELVEEVVDKRLPIEKLCDALIKGARRVKKNG